MMMMTKVFNINAAVMRNVLGTTALCLLPASSFAEFSILDIQLSTDFNNSADESWALGASQDGMTVFGWFGPTSGSGFCSLYGFALSDGSTAEVVNDSDCVINAIWFNPILFDSFQTVGYEQLNRAALVSDDGRYVAGTAAFKVINEDHAVRWELAGESGGEGKLILLGDTDGNGVIGNQSYELTMYESFATGMSSDGSAIVGAFNDGGYKHPFYWTEPIFDDGGDLIKGGMADLTAGVEWTYADALLEFYGNNKNLAEADNKWLEGYASDVSSDGKYVVGAQQKWDENWYSQTMAFLWDQVNGMINIANPDWFESYALAVSDDGSTVVGSAQVGESSSAYAPFVWKSGSGGVNIAADLVWVQNSEDNRAEFVSALGDVVFGQVLHQDWRTLSFRWTETDGLTPLDSDNSRFGAGTVQIVHDISEDGSVAVGYYSVRGPNTAFRWTKETGIIDIAEGSAYEGKQAEASFVSDDGLVITGQVQTALGDRAFIYRTVMLDAENTVSAIADNVVAQGTAIAALGAGLSFAAETELEVRTDTMPSTVSISSKSHSDRVPMAIKLGTSVASNADTGSLSFGSITAAIGLSEELTVGGFASLGTEASSLGGLGFDGTITSFGAFVRSTPLGGSGLTWKAALATSGGAVTISRDDSLVGTEAASGSSTLSSTAASFELGYRMAAQNRITTPFLRLAQTSTTRAAYDEDASYDFPISYDAVTEVVTTATLGLDSRSALDESNTLRLTGGLETDLARSNSPITGTSDIPNLTSFSIDAADIAAVQNLTRGYVGLGLTHDFGNGAAITFDVRADQNAFTATPTYSGGIAYQMKF